MISIRTLIALLMLGGWLSLGTASAQEYESLPIDEKFDIEQLSIDADSKEIAAHRRRNRDKTVALKNAENLFEDTLDAGGNLTASVTEYLDLYKFPSMTQTDPKTLSSLGETRARFLKDYFNEKIVGQTRQQMLTKTIAAMQGIMTNAKLHPAARLNAVYLLGQLDDAPPIRNQQGPRPSAEARTLLLQAFTGNDAQRYPTYVKIAALAGLQRHVETEKTAGRAFDQATQSSITAEINRLLDVPTDQDSAVNYWLKRRAMQVGGLVGDGKTVEHMLAVLKSKDETFWLQIDAVEALSKLGVLSVQNAENDAAAVAVTEFVVNGLDKEAKLIKAKVDRLVFDNILFSDVDLEEVGTNFSGDAAIGEGASAPGGGGGSGDKFGGMSGMGGPPAGGGFGGRGGGGVLTADPTGPKLELPNYELQSSRSRIKTIAVYGVKAIGEDDQTGIRRYLSDDAEKLAAQLVANLESLQVDSNIGIIDLDDRSRKDEATDEEEEDSFTQQLIDLCRQYSGDIKNNLQAFTVAQAGLPGAAAQPAASDN